MAALPHLIRPFIYGRSDLRFILLRSSSGIFASSWSAQKPQPLGGASLARGDQATYRSYRMEQCVVRLVVVGTTLVA